jgi:hypothetical protein
MEKWINLTVNQLAIINLILQVDKDWKQKTYSLWELQIANDIFKEIKNNVKDDKFQDWIANFNSEQKVFITKLINDREWGVLDAEHVFKLKELLN